MEAAHACDAQGEHGPAAECDRDPAQAGGHRGIDATVEDQFAFEARLPDQHGHADAEQAGRQQGHEAAQQPLERTLAQQPRQQRCQRQAEHRQRRQDVDVALAVGDREEQHDQQPPHQRQQVARIAPLQAPAPGRDRPRNRQEAGDPHRGHRAQEVPPRLVVIPGLGIAFGGLPEQDVVQVGPVLGRATAQRGHHHRHQPQRDGQHERQRA